MFKKWITLVSKELRLSLYSLSGILFMLLFLVISGCMLWLIPGNYNIPDAGYATMSSFFSLAPALLLFLIPALSMRSLAEEKRMQTFILLKSRPVSVSAIVSAKITAIFLTVLITLLPTFIYVLCIYFYGSPAGNIDLGAVAASYVGLLFLILAFVCLSVFASGLTSNSIIALITGMGLCVFFYFGWNLIGLEQFSFWSHYQSVQRGLIETQGLFYFLAVAFGFSILTMLFGVGSSLRRLKSKAPALHQASRRPAFNFDIAWTLCRTLIVSIIIAGLIFNFRFDWTKDQRYTISPVSKELVKNLDAPLDVEIYLTGNLNPGFTRLQEATINLLNDFNKLSAQKINGRLIDPYRQSKDFRDDLTKNNMQGISVNERSNDGKLTQNIIFPYALVKYQDHQIPVSLLVNQPGRSGEDNLNLSGELLEYKLVHAIRLLTQKESKRIVFLEGHGEFPEEAVSEITDRLSYEYTIDRGILSGQPDELNGYNLVIIAGAQSPFSEKDKFVLDQYLMQGGSLLWVINGIQWHDYEELAQTGETLSRVNDLNLNDLFFTYGLRINPVILQDVQSLNIPVATVNDSGETDYVSKPWYYTPLLIPANQLEITKGLSLVKAGFASTVSFVGDNPANRKEVLLSSSPYAHTIPVPAVISLGETDRKPDKSYFNEGNLPVAVLLQGVFPSVFKNRTAFTQTYPAYLSESRPAKMIIIATDELITNPLGYDRYSQTQFANKEFILNAVDFLTDNAGISGLKNKSLQLQLLNKQALQQDRNRIIFINIVLPPLILLLVFLVLSWIRKRKYTRFSSVSLSIL